MKHTSWKDIAELLGIAAIVASLIFVGLQMKQTHEIAISASFQSRAETMAAISIATTQSPELLSALVKLEVQSESREEFTNVEQRALCSWIQSFTWMLENSLIQYNAGFLPEDHWLRAKAIVKSVLKSGADERCSPFAPMTSEFLTEVDEIRQELREEGGPK